MRARSDERFRPRALSLPSAFAHGRMCPRALSPTGDPARVRFLTSRFSGMKISPPRPAGTHEAPKQSEAYLRPKPSSSPSGLHPSSGSASAVLPA